MLSIPRILISEPYADVLADILLKELGPEQRDRLRISCPPAGATREERIAWEDAVWEQWIKELTDPEEKKITKRLLKLFDGMKREVLGRMGQKSHLASVSKVSEPFKEGDIEGWLFGRKVWEKRFNTEGYDMLEGVTALGGKRALSELPVVGVGFDVTNPEVVKKLTARSKDFSKSVVGTTEEQIRRRLAEGIGKGESIGDLRERIAEYFDGDVIKNRAEMIARTETIWASNQGSLSAYRQSGVVDYKEWLVAGDARTCELCSAMGDKYGEGKGIDLDKSFAELGGTVEGTDGGTFTISYEDVDHPPLHVSCRCALVPHVKEFPAEDMPMTSTEGFLNCVASDSTKALGGCNDYVREGDKWFLGKQEVSGSDLKRLQRMRIPPAWRNVVASADEAAKVQAMGLDRAGRWQYRYSAEHVEEASRRKFDRLRLFSRSMPKIRKSIDEGISAGQSEAFLLRLEDKTAIRAGSARDFKAKTKAYGLTTLQHEHVTVKGSKITLDFVAKEGLPAHYELADKKLAAWLRKRKAATKSGERLFPDVPASKLNAFLKKIADGDYSIKDFRTYHGTRIAFEELRKHSGKVLTKKEKKAVTKDVLEKVSSFLANTPAMAKQSYIDPLVWEIIGGL